MKKTIIVTALCLFVVNVYAQGIEKDRLVFSWKNMKNMVVNSAKAMPETFYGFAPVEEVRGYADQMKHISTSNRFFITMVSGGDPNSVGAANKNTQENLKTKDEIIKDLEASFDYVIDMIPKISDFGEQMDMFGQQVTRIEALMLMEHHLHREQGKIITYMRIKGIAPAKSTSWLL